MAWDEVVTSDVDSEYELGGLPYRPGWLYRDNISCCLQQVAKFKWTGLFSGINSRRRRRSIVSHEAVTLSSFGAIVDMITTEKRLVHRYPASDSCRTDSSVLDIFRVGELYHAVCPGELM